MNNNDDYLAHVLQKPDDSWDKHELETHLIGTAKLAKKFAETFGSEDWLKSAALWHDLGKYGSDFQQYIRCASGYEPEEAHIESKGRVNHSSAGAIYAVEKLGLRGRILAYLIAGHHAGLADWYKLEGSSKGPLQPRLQDHGLLDHALVALIPEEILHPPEPSSQPIGGSRGFALWIRMLFSCLVDADFLDTEAFMNPANANQRGRHPKLTALLAPFNLHMEKLSAKPASEVNRLRAEILQQCRQAAQQTPGIFSLTVPTGGGKTLSSMAFALEHALKWNKARIIYAIPYTSIIEQTANVFRSIFDDAVIEHHSNLDPDRENSRSRLASENWDAPIIVTTNVQFFESLFAARTSRCRKLHNIANSIVILDEAQLLPTEFLKPTLEAIELLSTHYGVSFVLSTATQPALNTLRDNFGNTLLEGLDQVREIIPDPDQLYQQLDRVELQLPDNLKEPCSWPSLADALQEHDSVLTIVNSRKDAITLHNLMPKGTYHLSAQMCGQHRSDLIAEIKTRLKSGIPTRVISTQLVEAGVDLDFPVVYRALAGLDSIAQAAGRCNREGLLAGKGQVVLFIPPTKAPPGHLRRGAETSLSMLTGYEGNPLERSRFGDYFRHFYAKAPNLDEQDIQGLLAPQGEGDDQLKVQFHTAASRFRLIKETGCQVLVKYCTEKNREIEVLLGKLKKDGPETWLMRKLQRYSVTIPQYQFDKLMGNAEIHEISPGIHAQYSHTLYHPELGLLTEEQPLSPESLIC